MSSLFSLIIGTVVGLTQFRVKRLLAYSTISHVGFILLALSITSIESIQAFVFYLMQYSISNLNAFILLVAIGFSFVRRLALIMLASREVGVIDILYKSANLPKTEMVEGPQHVSKVDTGMGPKFYNCLRDTDLHDVYCYPS